MELLEFNLTPADYKRKDPRQLAYNYADTIQNSANGLVIYNKYVQQFIYNHTLDAVEQFAKNLGFILVPSSCIHWRRAKDIAHRRAIVGRKTFYALQEHELNDNEKKKLLDHLEEIKEAAAM